MKTQKNSLGGELFSTSLILGTSKTLYDFPPALQKAYGFYHLLTFPADQVKKAESAGHA